MKKSHLHCRMQYNAPHDLPVEPPLVIGLGLASAVASTLTPRDTCRILAGAQNTRNSSSFYGDTCRSTIALTLTLTSYSPNRPWNQSSWSIELVVWHWSQVESKELAKVELIDWVDRLSLKSSQLIQFCKVNFSHWLTKFVTQNGNRTPKLHIRNSNKSHYPVVYLHCCVCFFPVT